MEGVLSQPLLYLSLYFKENRDTYFELLRQVRKSCDWKAARQLTLLSNNPS